MNQRILTLAASSLLLSSCTTSLSVSELAAPAPGAGRPETLAAGMSYSLPAAVVTPTAFVAIRDCPADASLAKQLTGIRPIDARPVTEVTFVVGGAIAVAQVPDQRIVIDPRDLQKFLKTTSVGIERWPNGMLKAVNASIEDQTPQAIASLAAAIGSIALLSTGAPGAGLLLADGGLAGGPPGGPAPGGPAPGGPAPVTSKAVTFLACNARTQDLVDTRKVAAKSRETAADLLDQATTAASQLGAQPNADQAKLDKLKASVAKYSGEMDKATADLAAIDAQLTLPLDMVAPRDGSAPPAALPETGQVAPSRLRGGLAFSSARLDAFVAAHFVQATGLLPVSKHAAFDKRACMWNATTRSGMPDETCTSLAALKAVLAKAAKVELKDMTLVPVDEAVGDRRPSSAALKSVRKAEKGIPGSDIAANKGIIYVEPAKMRLMMSAPTIGPDSMISSTRVLKTADVSIPQLGRYMALPLRAGFGERVELKATFAEDGSLLTASFSNPKTSGVAIADTIRQMAALGVSTRDGVEDRKAKLAKTRAETLSSLLSAQDSVKKLTPTTDPLADINAELAKANAQAGLAEAQVRIQVAQDKLASP